MTQQAFDLQIGGMTCAACAACAVRIEKKLSRVPGVRASVNYATEKAHVVQPAGTGSAAAIATVVASGYTATHKGNLFWAFAHNIAALPLAMAGLLKPLIAGAAMAFCSAFVVSNRLRLSRFRAVSVQVAGNPTKMPGRATPAAGDAAV